MTPVNVVPPFVATCARMVRSAGLAAALLLSGCMTALAADPVDVIATPAGLEVTLWCARFPDAECRWQAREAARAQCGVAGARARFVRSALLQRTFTEGQLGWFLYDCIP
jgi:hypothetical protein